jgi:signal transduction histidine kinase
LIASAVGATLGFLIATFTARRLRRIARAANTIGSGDFSAAVRSRFPDEVGSLAESIERMRSQLEELFAVLKRDRDRLDHVFDRLDDGVFVVNRALEVEFANDRARALLGINGRLDDSRLRPLALGLFRTDRAERIRIVDGDQTLDVAGIPPGAGGDNAIIVVHDESQKERNDRVQRQFATNAAHELRTPLASIAAAVEMLETGAKDDPSARDGFLDLISRETARLTRLTRALLVLARADAGEEVPKRDNVPVEPLLERLAESLQPRQGVTVAVDCEEGLTITGDPELLEQALSSIATNAMQHTDRGSVILRGRSEKGSVLLEVVDTGRGIAEEERSRIFERFYRPGERDGGFGLGLSIAKGAVSALGGDIELDSKVGVGTTVRVKLAELGAVS